MQHFTCDHGLATVNLDGTHSSKRCAELGVIFVSFERVARKNKPQSFITSSKLWSSIHRFSKFFSLERPAVQLQYSASLVEDSTCKYQYSKTGNISVRQCLRSDGMFNDHSILNLLLSVSEKDFENRSIFDDVTKHDGFVLYGPPCRPIYLKDVLSLQSDPLCCVYLTPVRKCNHSILPIHPVYGGAIFPAHVYVHLQCTCMPTATYFAISFHPALKPTVCMCKMLWLLAHDRLTRPSPPAQNYRNL